MMGSPVTAAEITWNHIRWGRTEPVSSDPLAPTSYPCRMAAAYAEGSATLSDAHDVAGLFAADILQLEARIVELSDELGAVESENITLQRDKEAFRATLHASGTLLARVVYQRDRAYAALYRRRDAGRPPTGTA